MPDASLEHWQEHWPSFSFEKLVAMYINDCLQYLGEISLETTVFPPTETRDELYYGLRKLKSECMRVMGKPSFDWEGS